MQATRELRSTGINVSRTASGGHAGVATTFFALSVRPQLPRARTAMKNGGRDLKRATRAFGFVWSCYRYIWARSKSASRARLGGHINGTQRAISQTSSV